jgi:hypothetical protein
MENNFEIFVKKDQKNPEGESFEFNEEAKECLEKFANFSKENGDKIKEEMAKGKSLANVFYNLFYNNNRKNPEFVGGEEKFKKSRINFYKSKLKAREEILKKENTTDLRVITESEDYWLAVNLNGGLNLKNEALGRIYFNLNPDRLHYFFKKAIDKFLERGIAAQMKILNQEEVEDFNRSDKMLIYFSSWQEAAVIRAIEDLHREEKSVCDFSFDHPKFTVPVRDYEGTWISGISFGEEPIDHENSFGILRMKILEEIYHKAELQNLKVYNPKFNLKRAYAEACIKYGVDPENSAFNEKGGKFSLMRKRTKKLNID